MQTSSTYSVIFLSIMQGMSQKLFMYENVHVQADNNNASLKKKSARIQIADNKVTAAATNIQKDLNILSRIRLSANIIITVNEHLLGLN